MNIIKKWLVRRYISKKLSGSIKNKLMDWSAWASVGTINDLILLGTKPEEILMQVCREIAHNPNLSESAKNDFLLEISSELTNFRT